MSSAHRRRRTDHDGGTFRVASVELELSRGRRRDVRTTYRMFRPKGRQAARLAAERAALSYRTGQP